MFAYLLSNVYTKLGMVNGAQEMVEGFILYHQDILLLSHPTK